MKIHVSLFSLVLAASLFLGACKTNKDQFGEPYDKAEALNGTWKLVSVAQSDRSKTPIKTIDASKVMLGTVPAVLTINSNDQSYTVQANDSRNYLGDNGVWQFDDPLYPTAIDFTSNGITVEAKMLQSVRPFDENLKIEVVKDCSGYNLVGYQYTFERQ